MAVSVFVVAVLVVAGVAVLVRRGQGDGGGDVAFSTGPDELPDKSITLTEDTVVVRGNGGKTIKSFDASGSALTLDGNAEGADRLKPGSVLLLTGITALRVTSVERSGSDVKVTTGPVSLPEVVKDGELNWDGRSVDADHGVMSLLTPSEQGSGGTDGVDVGDADPQGSGSSVRSSESTDSGSSSPEDSHVGTRGGTGTGSDDTSAGGSGEQGMEHLNHGTRTAALPSPAGDASGELAAGILAGSTVSGKVGPFDASISYEASGGTHHLELRLKSSGELSGNLGIDVKLGSLAYSGGAKIAGSQVNNFDFSFSNLGGSAVITTDLRGLKNVAHIKTPSFLMLPFTVAFPAVVGGIPFTLSFTGSIRVAISMALENSSLSGRAEITYDGDAGLHLKSGSLSVDGKRSQDARNPLDSLKGLAPGPVGAVFTAQLPKIGFGFSFLGMSSGIYISNGFVLSEAILPAPAQCTASNLAYVLAGGIEASFLGKRLDIARKPVVRKEWNYQTPRNRRCNAPS